MIALLAGLSALRVFGFGFEIFDCWFFVCGLIITVYCNQYLDMYHIDTPPETLLKVVGGTIS